MPAPLAKLGQVLWVDLTTPDAPRLRDFYKSVVGWEPSPVPMGDYEDYNLLPPGSTKPAAGLCHARGPGANLPPQWLLYVPVENLNASLSRAEHLGGHVLQRLGPKCCIIQDPAGAVLALIEPEIATPDPE